MDIQDYIAMAHRFINRNEHDLAVFTLRDLPETEAACLKDLAWAYFKDGCTSREAYELVKDLERYLSEVAQ